jgi:preprotein translocase subunit YajC
MDHLLFLEQAAAGNGSWIMMIGYVVIIGGLFYFMAIRPQKKQQKQMSALISSLAIGDSVLTTSGFYGVVIDVMDEVIIVEFGNNKNCRIPMKKSAVVEVEKPETEESK